MRKLYIYQNARCNNKKAHCLCITNIRFLITDKVTQNVYEFLHRTHNRSVKTVDLGVIGMCDRAQLMRKWVST